jgi:hypothetical protein
MKKYAWKQLSQWDMPKSTYFTKSKMVKSGLSEALCTYLLVEEIAMGYLGSRYTKTVPIETLDVTDEMLLIAGDI